SLPYGGPDVAFPKDHAPLASRTDLNTLIIRPRRTGGSLQGPTPIAFGVDSTHLIATRPIAVKMAVLQLDTCALASVGDKANFDFCLQARVEVTASRQKAKGFVVGDLRTTFMSVSAHARVRNL